MGGAAWVYKVFATICHATPAFYLFIFISSNANLVVLLYIDEIPTNGESSLIIDYK